MYLVQWWMYLKMRRSGSSVVRRTVESLSAHYLYQENRDSETQSNGPSTEKVECLTWSRKHSRYFSTNYGITDIKIRCRLTSIVMDWWIAMIPESVVSLHFGPLGRVYPWSERYSGTMMLRCRSFYAVKHPFVALRLNPRIARLDRTVLVKIFSVSPGRVLSPCKSILLYTFTQPNLLEG